MLLLHIDTAVAKGSIALSSGDKVLATAESADTRDTAAWLQPAVRRVMEGAGYPLSDLDAVCVSAGPGSYTGLRVGMASAKGLCYALQKPLIALPTLLVMASAARPLAEGLLRPMIDARRAEVFTALYAHDLEELQPAHSLVLSPDSFAGELEKGPVSFFGNGAPKWKELMHPHPAALFLELNSTAADMIKPGLEAFAAARFADLAYGEPFYGKEFYTPVSPKIG